MCVEILQSTIRRPLPKLTRTENLQAAFEGFQFSVDAVIVGEVAEVACTISNQTMWTARGEHATPGSDLRNDNSIARGIPGEDGLPLVHTQTLSALSK